MNEAILIGNLGKDPEIKQLESGKMAQFSLATEDGYGEKKRTTWHTIKVFNNSVDAIEKYLHKGDKVAVSGMISTREYEGKWYTDIIARRVEFLSTHKPAQAEPGLHLPEPKKDGLPF